MTHNKQRTWEMQTNDEQPKHIPRNHRHHQQLLQGISHNLEQFVRLVITYAIETSAETAAIKKLLRSTEIRNEYIREQGEVQDIVRCA